MMSLYFICFGIAGEGVATGAFRVRSLGHSARVMGLCVLGYIETCCGSVEPQTLNPQLY